MSGITRRYSRLPESDKFVSHKNIWVWPRSKRFKTIPHLYKRVKVPKYEAQRVFCNIIGSVFCIKKSKCWGCKLAFLFSLYIQPKNIQHLIYINILFGVKSFQLSFVCEIVCKLVFLLKLLKGYLENYANILFINIKSLSLF